MRFNLVTACELVAASLLTNAAQADDKMDHGAMQHSEMQQDHEAKGHQMAGFYGPYSMKREASGTSWQPEATPMGGLHIMKGDWMFMIHGSADLVYDHQGGKRGDDEIFSPNMFMVMGNR